MSRPTITVPTTMITKAVSRGSPAPMQKTAMYAAIIITSP